MGRPKPHRDGDMRWEIMKLEAEVTRLRGLLETIRDTATSTVNDDFIWMDDQTTLGGFIDANLKA